MRAKKSVTKRKAIKKVVHKKRKSSPSRPKKGRAKAGIINTGGFPK